MTSRAQQPPRTQQAFSKELVAASSEPLLLSILSRGESYGYEIIQQVRAFSGGQLEWTDGMLYPVLHRLERQGLIRARWQLSAAGRRRKYYALTSEGTLALRERRRQWDIVAATLARVAGTQIGATRVGEAQACST